MDAELSLTGICWGVGYYLFYSTHNYNTLNYDIRYAVSRSAFGPFKKVGTFLKR